MYNSNAITKIADKVVRPSTVYHVVASLASDSSNCRIMASISRNGVAVSNNEIQLHPSQSQAILLKVPPDNSGDKGSFFLKNEFRKSIVAPSYNSDIRNVF